MIPLGGWAAATLAAGTPAPVNVIEVRSGQTLYDIASGVAKPGQVQEMVYRIEQLNSLPSATIPRARGSPFRAAEPPAGTAPGTQTCRRPTSTRVVGAGEEHGVGPHSPCALTGRSHLVRHARRPPRSPWVRRAVLGQVWSGRVRPGSHPR